MQPKVPTFFVPHKIKIGKRNGRAPKKRTKIKCPFLKSGNFSLQKKHDFRVVMQMQRIPKKSRKMCYHKILIINSQKDLGEKCVVQIYRKNDYEKLAKKCPKVFM